MGGGWLRRTGDGVLSGGRRVPDGGESGCCRVGPLVPVVVAGHTEEDGPGQRRG